MNGIKFSHIYEKMPENLKDLEATLLEVLFVGSKNELSSPRGQQFRINIVKDE